MKKKWSPHLGPDMQNKLKFVDVYTGSAQSKRGPDAMYTYIHLYGVPPAQRGPPQES